MEETLTPEEHRIAALEDELTNERHKSQKECVLIPEEITFHNACTDRCDCIHAPCACGSQHDEEWILKQWAEQGIRAEAAEAKLKAIYEVDKQLWKFIGWPENGKTIYDSVVEKVQLQQDTADALYNTCKERDRFRKSLKEMVAWVGKQHSEPPPILQAQAALSVQEPEAK